MRGKYICSATSLGVNTLFQMRTSSIRPPKKRGLLPPTPPIYKVVDTMGGCSVGPLGILPTSTPFLYAERFTPSCTRAIYAHAPGVYGIPIKVSETSKFHTQIKSSPSWCPPGGSSPIEKPHQVGRSPNIESHVATSESAHKCPSVWFNPQGDRLARPPTYAHHIYSSVQPHRVGCAIKL